MDGEPRHNRQTGPGSERLSLLGGSRIKAITAPMMLDVLRRIEARGALEVARRVRGICSLAFVSPSLAAWAIKTRLHL